MNCTMQRPLEHGRDNESKPVHVCAPQQISLPEGMVCMTAHQIMFHNMSCPTVLYIVL